MQERIVFLYNAKPTDGNRLIMQSEVCGLVTVEIAMPANV